MTSEFLLDAIGLLDDDLIQDAEQVPARSKAVPFPTRLASLAACLALVIILSYGVTHLPFGASKSDTGAASTGSTSASAGGSGASSQTQEDAADSAPAPSELEGLNEGIILVGTNAYQLTGDALDALPGSCRVLGILDFSANADAATPSVDVEEYVGCTLWAQEDTEAPSALYLQLPDGRYAVAELVQP